MEALRPNERRRLVAFHEGRKLAGHVDVRGDADGIVELKLQPWGSITGRLVDDDGMPRQRVDLLNDERYDVPAQTDSQGRFRIEGLVPGKPAKIWVSLNAGYLSGTIATKLVLLPGEVKDLGDVREKE